MANTGHRPGIAELIRKGCTPKEKKSPTQLPRGELGIEKRAVRQTDIKTYRHTLKFKKKERERDTHRKRERERERERES